MSEHGRTGSLNRQQPDWLRNSNSVSKHRGSAQDFLYRHRKHVEHVLQQGREGLLEIVPLLLDRIADTRTLGVAWDYLATHGGHAPGPDGLHFSDIDVAQKWPLLREIRDEIRAGGYKPGKEHLRWIPKRSGKGSRPLIIQSILDRVVQRATVEIVQPLLDARFDPRSFGFRPRRGTLDALACAERLSVDEERWVWVAADIKDAFCNVPLPRLLQIIRKKLPDEELVDFLQRVLGDARMDGLRQGGPLSPLLLNVYLDHVLDRRWRQMFPGVPLIRYADDILLLCASRKQAHKAYQAVVEILGPAGMRVKEDAQAAVRQLKLGDKVQYMGFEIGKGEDRLQIGLAKSAWEGLADNLDDAHEAPASALRAVQSVCGWLYERAACFPDLGLDTVYARVQKIASEYAYDELLDPGEVQKLGEEALHRWQDARHAARAYGSALPT